MNIQALNEFSGLCFLLGIVFFILAMVLFVVLRIPRVIGFFTGHAERKAIAFISEGSRRGGVGGIRLNGKINMQQLGLAGEAGEADPSLRETELLNAGESCAGETELLTRGEENETGQSEPEENKPEQGKYRVEVELESEARAEIIR